MVASKLTEHQTWSRLSPSQAQPASTAMPITASNSTRKVGGWGAQPCTDHSLATLRRFCLQRRLSPLLIRLSATHNFKAPIAQAHYQNSEREYLKRRNTKERDAHEAVQNTDSPGEIGTTVPEQVLRPAYRQSEREYLRKCNLHRGCCRSRRWPGL